MSHSQSPGQPGNQASGPVPPQPRESWLRRHKFVTAFGVVGSLSIIIGVVVAVTGGGQGAAAPSAALSSPAAEPTVTPLSPALGSSATARSSGAASASANRSSASANRSSASANRSPGAAAKLAVAPNTVTTYSGSGIETTPKFTTTATWQLAYSFNCSEFGQPTEVQVEEDGGSDLNRALLNEKTLKTEGSTPVHDDAGSHYLKVNTACSWSVKVVDES
jgi:hypothetical protein